MASAGIDGFDLNFDVGWLAKAVDKSCALQVFVDRGEEINIERGRIVRRLLSYNLSNILCYSNTNSTASY